MKHYVFVLLVAVFAVDAGSAQAPTDPPNSSAFSASWEVRRDAFWATLGIKQQVSFSAVVAAAHALRDLAPEQDGAASKRSFLSTLLAFENRAAAEGARRARADPAGEQLGHYRLQEDYLDYYAEVVAAVVTVRDPGSLPALVGAIKTGGMAARAVLSFGADAVAPLATTQKSDDRQTRLLGIIVLTRLLM
jgi:hypothetical protein